ncbi:hypothetical protein J5226_11410 [Lysobacter sp. K5869]|uniref:hypothetical protein n=1 Tax=Lysobacter sp. K5869 TaxID=2820808 RepID=UPI001C0616D6|nr:hypothetical protein [Lysobacter sp. K5869]QWP78950.1 hypothetical protein J5226_11410 [Lysobacter sp. K5869]
MNIEEIALKISAIRWFSNSGSFPGKAGMQPIGDLAAWDSSVFAAGIDTRHAKIAADMDWLPTNRDQDDPFNGNLLLDALRDADPQIQSLVMDIYKQTMESLRVMKASKLTSGANDFSEAARGSALYCSRMATIEAATGKPATWCDLLEIYSAGYWPCGLLPNGDIVVY